MTPRIFSRLSSPLFLALLAAAAAQAPPTGLVVGAGHEVAGAARAATLARWQQAASVLPVLRPPAAPYIFKLDFVAADAAGDQADGFLQQAWQSESQWIWTAHLGELPMDRMAKGHDVVTTQGPLSQVPLREMMLRAALFSPEGDGGIDPQASLRAASGTWQSQPVDCLLVASKVANAATVAPTAQRAPQEQEFCLDAGGRLVVASPMPDYLVAYGYASAANSAATVTIAEAGRVVLAAKVDFALPLTGALPLAWLQGGGGTAAQAQGAAADSSDSMAMKRACKSCLATMNDTDNALARASSLAAPTVLWRSLPAPAKAGATVPAAVVALASLAPDGAVNDADIWGATDPGLLQAAQELLRKNPLGKSNEQRLLFLGIEFTSR